MAWKGWLIDKSLRDKGILKKLNVLASFAERNKEGDKERIWKLNVIEVSSKDMTKVARELERNLKFGYYTHFTDYKNLIVIFRGKSFRIKLRKVLKETKFGAVKFRADTKSLGIWNKALDYGTKEGRVDSRYIIKVV